eukprot:scaffold176604_cov18-Tisochrysis_lutea.AAC.1
MDILSLRLSRFEPSFAGQDVRLGNTPSSCVVSSGTNIANQQLPKAEQHFRFTVLSILPDGQGSNNCAMMVIHHVRVLVLDPSIFGFQGGICHLRQGGHGSRTAAAAGAGAAAS